jgi:F-type H+-transporting ATPase subunit alpha
MLKQAQYSPVPVELQVAIIYVSTNGLMDSIPVSKVKEFEKAFYSILTTTHKATLEALRKGKLDAEQTDVLKQVARETSSKFSV